MTRKPSQTPPQSPVLNAVQIRHRIGRIESCIRDLEAFDPHQFQRWRNVPEIVALEAAIRDALVAAFGDGTSRFKSFSSAADLYQGPSVIAMSTGFGSRPNHEVQEAQQAQKYLSIGKETSLQLLRSAVSSLQADLAEQEALEDGQMEKPVEPVRSNKVFLVHGHDKAVREGVARFLEQLGLDVIILDEQPNQGRTIIEKFEHGAREAGFAVVLLTPDDIAGSKADPQASTRSRQNVIFELGFFAGHLGRGCVCLLRKGDVEIPSDLHGVVYTEFDEKGGWKISLVQEMKATGLKFDANKMWA
ncbi:MAG: TIR domain-containing protein [Rhodomicrobium sp.]